MKFETSFLELISWTQRNVVQAKKNIKTFDTKQKTQNAISFPHTAHT